MSTTIKGGSFGREKKGISPSPSFNKKPLKPSSSSSPSPSTTTASSSTNVKPVPNYLKPTISSNLDFSRLPKKSTAESSAAKQVFDRRTSTSFSRPPSSSQDHKTPRNVVPRGPEIRHTRSSSISHNSGPALERVYPRASSSLSKSRTIKKKVLDNNATVPESSSKFDNESIHVNVDDETQSLPEISEMPNGSRVLGDPQPVENQNEGKTDDVDQVVAHVVVTSVTVEPAVEEPVCYRPKANVTVEVTEDTYEAEMGVPIVAQTEAPAVAKTEVSAVAQAEAPAIVHTETSDVAQAEASIVAQAEASTVAQTETSAVVQTATLQTGTCAVVQTETSTVARTEAIPEEKKEEVVSERDEAEKKSVDTLPIQSSPNNVLPKSDAAEPVKAKAPAAGKKEKQEYNNVIEETATKLRGGNNKSKVLALAGAFKTVISLEGHKKT